MNFHSTDTPFCPGCEPKFRGDGTRSGVKLDLVVRNYMDCYADIAECPECQRAFQVSYRVESVKQVYGWGGNDEPCPTPF